MHGFVTEGVFSCSSWVGGYAGGDGVRFLLAERKFGGRGLTHRSVMQVVLTHLRVSEVTASNVGG